MDAAAGRGVPVHGSLAVGVVVASHRNVHEPLPESVVSFCDGLPH